MHERLDELEFRQISNRVTVLDRRQNYVFAQYLEKELTRKHNKFCIHIIIDKIYLLIVNIAFANLH